VNGVRTIDLSRQFIRDMMKMFHDGSCNDVCIKLFDGEIKANRSVLATRCEYFAATFRWKSNNNHDVEDIVVNDCSKKVMTRIMNYLFSGVLKIDDLSFLELLQLKDQVRKMLPGDELEYFLREYIYNPDSLTQEYRDRGGGPFFPSDEEIVKTLSLVESGNLQMHDPEEIEEIHELYKNSRDKILSLASFAYHGVLQQVSELSLCREGGGVVDLGFVPTDHLRTLIPCVKERIDMGNVTGYDVTSFLDSVNCTNLLLKPTLNQEETDALVRAMNTRVDHVSLADLGSLSFDVDTLRSLTKYKGDGKCSTINCFWYEPNGWQQQPVIEWAEQWARRMNWSVVARYVFSDNKLYTMCLKRTKT